MPVKQGDRAQFEAFGDLGLDDQGREILVGLSYEETEWYLDVLERERSGESATESERDRKSALVVRHNAVRLQQIEAVFDVRFSAEWTARRSGRRPSGGAKIARRVRNGLTEPSHQSPPA